MTEETKDKEVPFDPLDMKNYRIEKLPKMKKSGFERYMALAGGPLALIAFVVIYFFLDIPFLNNIDFGGLEGAALKRFELLGAESFVRINYAMLGIFVASTILWMTEAVPNYLTSLFVILAIVLTQVTSDKDAYAQLGHPIMWLNILSFVLASMLVKTQVAKRFALWFVLRFGKNSAGIIFSFIVINVVLSAFISATTAKATILLPIFMVVAAIYGAQDGNRNNFGRNIVLQNLFQINMGAACFLTGSGANLLAASLIAGAVGSQIFFGQWLAAAFPLAICLILIGWFVGSKIYFPLKKEEDKPQIAGGMEYLKRELKAMGKMTLDEYKSVVLFVTILILWSTDSLHGIDQTTVAFCGAVIALTPKIGIVKWNDIDIPWHLMIFSAGAYTLGAGLKVTDLPATMVSASFASLGLGSDTPFWILYVLLTAMMLFSGLVFQSKTMRALIFVPIAIGVATEFGYPVMSLAFPVALLIEHVYTFPFNSKPAAVLYTTNQYSISDSFKFGITMMCIAYIFILLWGETVLRWLGHTEGLFFR